MVRVEGYGRSRREIAEAYYSYRVEGGFYSGAHVVNPGLWGGCRESKFEAFPTGSRVVVHYKPSKYHFWTGKICGRGESA
jgi:hypothetical protein